MSILNVYGRGYPNIYLSNEANPTIRGCKIYNSKSHGHRSMRIVWMEKKF